MDLFLVRHAIAHERDLNRWPDDGRRPLTSEGKQSFRQAARGLRSLVDPPVLVFCSPLTRARQTARILERRAGWPAARVTPLLAEGAGWAELSVLCADHESVAFVGHEPHLSDLCAALLAGQTSARIEFRKGTVARLAIEPDSERATLRALWPPATLRAVRGSRG